MKTKEKRKKIVIEQIREIRDKVSHDIQNMSFKQLTEYLKDRKSLHPTFSKNYNK